MSLFIGNCPETREVICRAMRTQFFRQEANGGTDRRITPLRAVREESAWPVTSLNKSPPEIPSRANQVSAGIRS